MTKRKALKNYFRTWVIITLYNFVFFACFSKFEISRAYNENDSKRNRYILECK